MPTESVGIFIIYAVAIKTKWQCCTQQINVAFSRKATLHLLGVF